MPDVSGKPGTVSSMMTPAEWLAWETEQFSRRCVHCRGLGQCAVGLDQREISGTRDRYDWERPPWWMFRPCLGDHPKKEGNATCERYEPPTEDQLIDYAVRLETERLQRIREDEEQQRQQDERAARERQRIQERKKVRRYFP